MVHFVAAAHIISILQVKNGARAFPPIHLSGELTTGSLQPRERLQLFHTKKVKYDISRTKEIHGQFVIFLS